MSRVIYLALNAADHLVSKGRLDAAASILRNYLSTNDPEPMVMQRLGRIFLAQGRSAEAVPLLQEALVYFQQQAKADASSAHANANDGQAVSTTFDPAVTQTSIDDHFIAMHWLVPVGAWLFFTNYPRQRIARYNQVKKFLQCFEGLSEQTD